MSDTVVVDSILKPPPWAANPPRNEKWVLVEIKDGVVVDEHDITSRLHTIIGRNAHIVQHHASISRQHARLAFDSNGTLWFRDLSSAHGVRVNKQQLPKQSIGKIESMSTEPGTRGVILNPGDIIQIGASTRLFIVEKESLKNHDTDDKNETNDTYQLEIGFADSQMPINPTDTTCDDHFDISNEVRDSDDREIQIPTDVYDVPENLRKDWYKIQELSYKLENIRQESDRIRNKLSTQEHLSTGQERQLERNDEKIEQLEYQIENRKSEFYDKFNNTTSTEHGNSSCSRKRKKPKEEYDDDDHDSYFDRTINQNIESTSRDVETEESLIIKWKDKFANKSRLMITLTKATNIVNQYEQKLKNLVNGSGNENVEDAFFLQNDLSIAKENHMKIQMEMNRIEESLFDTKRLLAITSPHLNVNIENGEIIKLISKSKPKNETMTKKSDLTSTSMDSPLKKSNVVDCNRNQHVHSLSPTSSSTFTSPFLNDNMPPPPSQRVNRTTSTHNGTRGQATEPNGTGGSLPTNLCKEIENRSVSSHMIPPTTIQKLSTTKEDSKKKTNRSIVQPHSTLEVVFGATKKDSGSSSSVEDNDMPQGIESIDRHVPKRRQTVVPIHRTNAMVTAFDNSASSTENVDTCADSWHAPNDQDGSGYTKLNSKFHGRY